jgi:hypothetical protein
MVGVARADQGSAVVKHRSTFAVYYAAKAETLDKELHTSKFLTSNQGYLTND